MTDTNPRADLGRLKERLQIRWGAPSKDGVTRAMVDYEDLRAAIAELTAARAAKVAADPDLDCEAGSPDQGEEG